MCRAPDQALFSHHWSVAQQSSIASNLCPGVPRRAADGWRAGTVLAITSNPLFTGVT